MAQLDIFKLSCFFFFESASFLSIIKFSQASQNNTGYLSLHMHVIRTHMCTHIHIIILITTYSNLKIQGIVSNNSQKHDKYKEI